MGNEGAGHQAAGGDDACVEGGVQRAIGQEPGDVLDDRGARLVELPDNDDASIGPKVGVEHRGRAIIRGRRTIQVQGGARVESALEASIRVQAGQIHPRGAVEGGKAASAENFPVALDEDLARGRVEAEARVKPQVERPVRVEARDA